MIVLNGKKFARDDKEFIDSLFKKSGTCTGFYRVNKRTVSLLNLQKEKIGVITFRGVLVKASLQDDGKYWYSYGDVLGIGRYESYTQETAEVQAVLNKFNIQCVW